MDTIYLRGLASRYERLARRLDAGEQGVFLRTMAEGYLTLAEQAPPPAPRAPRLGREALGHRARATGDTPDALAIGNTRPADRPIS